MPPELARLANLPEVRANGGKVPAHNIDVFAARTVYASSIPGVVPNCNLFTGLTATGGTPTNNATALNAVLATATASNPVHLVLDGGFAIGHALVIPSTGHVTISGQGWSTGLYILPGSNCNPITNTDGTDLAAYQDGWAPGLGITANRGKDVTLRDFRINCNRGTYPNGNCNGGVDGTNGVASSPDARGSQTGSWWLTGPLFVGLDNLAFERVWIYDSPSLHILLCACTHVRVHDCRIEAATPSFSGNTDGVHCNGGCSDVRVSDCWFATGDDCVAFNMDEGNGQDGADLVMADCVSVGCQTVLRVYGKSNAACRRVEMRNVKASGIRYWAITIGDDGGSGATLAEATHSLSVTDCDFQFANGQGFDNSVLSVAGNAGSVELCRVRVHEPNRADPLVLMTALTSTISRLAVLDCSVYRNTFGSAAAYLLDGGHGTIGDLVIENFHYAEQSGQAFTDVASLINLHGTTVGSLTLSGKFKGVGTLVNVASSSTVGAIDLPDVTHRSNAGSPAAYTVVAAGSTVPVSVGRYRGVNLAGVASGTVSLTGPGLTSSGFAIADTLAAAGTIYRSSTQNGLVYKDASSAVNIFSFGAPAAASAYTLTGPSAGTTGSPSTNFTVAPNGVYTGTITVAISGGGLSGTVVKTFSASATPQTFTITPTIDGTVSLTGSNGGGLTNPSALGYVASAGATTYLSDTFTGTPGTTVASRVPDTVQNGSDTWTALSGAPQIASGGGVVGTSGATFTIEYPMTGVGADGVYTFTWINNSGSGAVPAVSLRSDSGGGTDLLQWQWNYGLNQVNLLVVTGGSVVNNFAHSCTLTSGALTTVEIDLSGTTAVTKLNGTTVGTDTVPSSSLSAMFLQQITGATGNFKVKSVSVRSS